MTINKSLIAILFGLTASLSQAEGPTPLQAAGGVLFMNGIIVGDLGKKLIQNGYANLSLAKMPSPLKTPHAMRKYAMFSIPVGLAAMASPLIFEKAEQLGKEYREQKEKIDPKKLNKSDHLDESLVVV